MRNRWLMLGGCVLALWLAGCAAASASPGPESAPPESASSAGQTAGEAGGPGAYRSVAMYVPLGRDSYVMVDQENGAVFTVRMPEALYGLDGQRITPDRLEKGNLLEITGDGVMMESYPGQYPGVTEIRVLEQGAPSDADRYQELVDMLYQEPDPAEPPGLNIEYRDPQAAVCAAITRGGYEWSYPGEDGRTETAVACGAHPLQWREISDLALPEPLPLTLLFYREEPTAVKVIRWPSGLADPDGRSDPPEGESVPLLREAGRVVIPDAGPGYLYQVDAEWEQGTAQFAFVTR